MARGGGPRYVAESSAPPGVREGGAWPSLTESARRLGGVTVDTANDGGVSQERPRACSRAPTGTTDGSTGAAALRVAASAGTAHRSKNGLAGGEALLSLAERHAQPAVTRHVVMGP